MNTGRSETEWRVGDTNYGTRKKKYKKEEKIEKKTRLGTAGTEYKINDKPLQSARPTHGYLCTMPIPGCKIVKSETGCRLGRTKGKKKREFHLSASFGKPVSSLSQAVAT